MNHNRCVRVATACAALVLTAVSARAQAPVEPAGATQMLSANPFALMFEWFNADYEHRMTTNSTWGAAGSVFSFDDFDYRSATVAFKYYPRAPMDGFYVGGRTGVYHVSNIVDSDNVYGAGFEIGYNWLLGRRQNVAVGIGAGVMRLFGPDLIGASVAVPTVRLVNVGFVF